MNKIAVLGANGQLGKTLHSLIKDDGFNTYFFYTKNDINIINTESLEAVFNAQDFDYCINCAAYTNVEAAENNIDQTFSINAEGAKNIAEACKINKTKLIHISTDYVFDGNKESPYTTNDKTNPINQYGKSKLKGELYIQEILNEHYIIRTSWLYSPHGKNFVKTIINKIEENKTLNVTTEEIGTPSSCIDLSNFIFHLIKNNKIAYGTYNFSARGSTTWYGFAREIVKNYRNESINIILPTDHFKTLAKRPKYSILDISKTEKVYANLSKWELSVKKVVERIKTDLERKI